MNQRHPLHAVVRPVSMEHKKPKILHPKRRLCRAVVNPSAAQTHGTTSKLRDLRPLRVYDRTGDTVRRHCLSVCGAGLATYRTLDMKADSHLTSQQMGRTLTRPACPQKERERERECILSPSAPPASGARPIHGKAQ